MRSRESWTITERLWDIFESIFTAPHCISLTAQKSEMTSWMGEMYWSQVLRLTFLSKVAFRKDQLITPLLTSAYGLSPPPSVSLIQRMFFPRKYNALVTSRKNFLKPCKDCRIVTPEQNYNADIRRLMHIEYYDAKRQCWLAPWACNAMRREQ